MPAPPEFRGGERLVGTVEVLGQAESHQERHADGDIGVSREIGIDLQRIGEQGNQVFKAREQERRIEHTVHEVGGQVVAQDDLLGKAVQHPEHGNTEGAAGEEILLVELGDELVGSHDGACHQLGEKGEVEPEIQDVVNSLDFSAVDVDAVTDGLEGKEGNAHRQDDGIY